MSDSIQVVIPAADEQWAIQTAQSSIQKWAYVEGHYNHRLHSRLKGKPGEIGVGEYLLEKKSKINSLFRFAEREKMCNMVVKVNDYSRVSPLEVKTWNGNHWAELGRCIAVEQNPDLKRKADIIV